MNRSLTPLFLSHRQRTVPAILLAMGACALPFHHASAATYVRTAGTTGDYGDTSLYAPAGTLPGAADTVTSDGTGTIINFTAPDNGDALNTLSLNPTSGATTFNQSAGTFTLGTLNLGGAAGAENPVYNLTAGTLNINTALNWGGGTAAAFNVSGGTANYGAAGLSFGAGSGASSTINISAGTFNANALTSLNLGTNSTGVGTIALSGSGVFSDTTTATSQFNIGNGSTGTSAITLANTSQFNAPNATIVAGQFGGASGLLTVNDTASVTALRIVLGGFNGANNGGFGIVTLNGGTVTTSSIAIGVGATGTPSATHNALIGNGGTVVASAANASFFNGAFVSLSAGGLTFNTNGNADTINNVMSGVGGFTASGTGQLTLTGLNTYTGGTTVNTGTLNLGAGGGSGAVVGTLTVNPGANLILSANNALGFLSTAQTVTTLNVNGGTVTSTASGAGFNQGYLTSFNLTGGTVAATGATPATYNFNVGAATPPTITSNASATTSTISGGVVIRNGGSLAFNVASGAAGTTNGSDLTVSGVISGSAANSGLTKGGAGAMLLTATNTYTGATAVNAGSLFVSGGTTASYAGGVTVTGTGTTLAGTGTISGAVTIGNGAVLTVGNRTLPTPAVGNLTTGALTLQTGSTFNAVLSGDNSFSMLNASGATSLTGVAFSITLTPGATFTNGKVLELISSQFSGTFTNSTYTTGGYTFTADYTGAPDLGAFAVDVSRAAVPEPATWAGLLTLAALAGCASLRRRRHARLG